MAEIYQRYKPNKDLHFVSISVNPEFDSPQVLAKYAHDYQANTSQWHFLTGSREAIQDLAVNGFKIGSIEEPIFHSGYFVLVDRSGGIRGYYDGTKPEHVRELSRDLAVILRQ